MSEHKAFGGQSSVESLKLLSQFKKLDLKRSQGLSSAEESLYQELLLKLGKLIDGKVLRPQQQKRKNLRVNTSRHVQFASGAALQKAMMHNISGGGLYLATKDFLAIGSKVELKIEVSTSQKPLELDAVVTWVNPKGIEQLPPGMGLRFENLSREQNQKLKDLLHSSLDQKLGKT